MSIDINDLDAFDVALGNFFAEVKEAIDKKQNKANYLLKDTTVSGGIGNFLYRDFGLIGGSYAVLVKGTNEPLLLYNTDIVTNKDINESDYFWFPYSSVFNNADALNIDISFAGIRSSQGLYSTPPEFLNHLNKSKDETSVASYCDTFLQDIYTSQKELNTYPILYCDAVEVAFFCLLYVFLLDIEIREGKEVHNLEQGINLNKNKETNKINFIDYFTQQKIDTLLFGKR